MYYWVVGVGLGYLDSAILMAVARGQNTLKALRYLFPGVDPGVLEARLRSLEASGYLASRVKGLIFKTREYFLTEKGARALDEASKKLEEAAERAKSLAEEGRPVSQWPVELAWVLPLLLWLGLLDLALLPLIGMEFVDDVGDFGEDLETGYEEAGLEGLDFEV